jgi:AcrR family transcriptional regulator
MPGSVTPRLVSRYPRRGGVQVSDVQRSRVLRSVVAVVQECGYGEMSISRVTSRAGVSRRTFYELFENREESFLATFDDAVAEMTMLATQAWKTQELWSERVREALEALLRHLDEQRGIGKLVFVEALGAGPRVLKHRARLLAGLTKLVDEGRVQAGRRREPPPLTAEGVVGAVLAVIHARLLEGSTVSLIRLLNPLMVMIVAPYLGDAAAAEQLERPMPRSAPRRSREPGNPLHGLNMRITHRTMTVLAAIAGEPGASNRQISDRAGIADQGQMSKLLTRLESLGLAENTALGQPSGEPNQWRLTLRGEEMQRALGVHTAGADAVQERVS